MRTLLKLWLLAIFTSTSDADPPSQHPSQAQETTKTEASDTHASDRDVVTGTVAALRAIDLEVWTNQIVHYFRLFTKAGRLHVAAAELPDTDAAFVSPMVIAAIAEETPKAPAALLVALAWGESRFDQRAQPLCGVLQVNPVDIGRPASDCAVWRGDLQLAVRAGVTEIEMMLVDHRVAGDLRKMLLYRACGNKAFDGTCDSKKYAWVEAAIARYKQIERTMARVATS